jgi:hypothetical protein
MLYSHHTYNRHPYRILCAKGPDSTQLISGEQCRDMYQLEQLLQPRYTTIGDKNIPLFTWGKFLCDVSLVRSASLRFIPLFPSVVY